MADEINVQYQGKLRCKATLQKNGQSVQTDVDLEHGGQGDYLSPVEMTVAALGTCAMSMVAVVAERNGVDVSKLQATAGFNMASAPHRRIGSVQLTIHLPGDVPEAVRPKLEMAAKACPVKNSLNPDIVVDLKLVYG